MSPCITMQEEIKENPPKPKANLVEGDDVAIVSQAMLMADVNN